jgi:hypothetical protein
MPVNPYIRACAFDVAARAARGNGSLVAAELCTIAADLIARHARGDHLDGPDHARLAVALHVGPVRDVACAVITRETAADLADRWTGFSRTVPPALVGPPAYLAGYASLVAGFGSRVARAAFDVATAADPESRAPRLALRLYELGGAGELLAAARDAAPELAAAAPTGDWLQPLLRRLRVAADLGLTI